MMTSDDEFYFIGFWGSCTEAQGCNSPTAAGRGEVVVTPQRDECGAVLGAERDAWRMGSVCRLVSGHKHDGRFDKAQYRCLSDDLR